MFSRYISPGLPRHLRDIITLNMYTNYTDNSDGNESDSSSDDNFMEIVLKH